MKIPVPKAFAKKSETRQAIARHHADGQGDGCGHRGHRQTVDHPERKFGLREELYIMAQHGPGFAPEMGKGVEIVDLRIRLST